jgi:hypothetical protein
MSGALVRPVSRHTHRASRSCIQDTAFDGSFVRETMRGWRNRLILPRERGDPPGTNLESLVEWVPRPRQCHSCEQLQNRENCGCFKPGLTTIHSEQRARLKMPAYSRPIAGWKGCEHQQSANPAPLFGGKGPQAARHGNEELVESNGAGFLETVEEAS